MSQQVSGHKYFITSIVQKMYNEHPSIASSVLWHRNTFFHMNFFAISY
ncbi:hypothetical protein JAB6_56090 [Janthinobacterium sp. HH104]|nr:hypothetical protein JAB6_56090 [Janthinobacterium sp. HH104]